MRYVKPLVVSLSTRAKGEGDFMFSCIPGNSPAGGEKVCGTGSSPTWSAACAPGLTTGDCGSGTTASFTCNSGPSTDLGYECSGGTGGTMATCTTGISALP